MLKTPRHEFVFAWTLWISRRLCFGHVIGDNKEPKKNIVVF